MSCPKAGLVRQLVVMPGSVAMAGPAGSHSFGMTVRTSCCALLPVIDFPTLADTEKSDKSVESYESRKNNKNR